MRVQLTGILYEYACCQKSLRLSNAYMSVNYAIIGWDNSLSTVQHQTIICANAEVLIIGHLWTNMWNLNWTICISIQAKMFGKVV